MKKKRTFSLRHYAYGSGSYEEVDLGMMILFSEDDGVTIPIPDKIVREIGDLLWTLIPEGEILNA